MIQMLSDVLFQQQVQGAEIDAEARFGVRLAPDHHLERVVVPVTMRIGAGAEGLLVTLFRPVLPVVAMCGAEMDDACEVDSGPSSPAAARPRLAGQAPL